MNKSAIEREIKEIQELRGAAFHAALHAYACATRMGKRDTARDIETRLYHLTIDLGRMETSFGITLLCETFKSDSEVSLDVLKDVIIHATNCQKEELHPIYDQLRNLIELVTKECPLCPSDTKQFETPL